jgi:hypothetical protein
VAGKDFGIDRSCDGRHVEDLCDLGQTHGIVLQGLPVDVLHTEGLRLLVDEDQLAVVLGQVFVFLDYS